MIDLIRGLLQREPARFVAYGAAVSVWAVTRLGTAIGIEVPDEVTLAVATIATFILTEVIRRLVYSPANVAQIVAQIPPGSEMKTAAAVLDGAPPAVKPANLPGGGGGEVVN